MFEHTRTRNTHAYRCRCALRGFVTIFISPLTFVGLRTHTQRHRHQYPYICVRSDDRAQQAFMPHTTVEETRGSARQKPASPPWISCHPQIRALISVLCPQPTAFALPSGRRRHLSLARTRTKNAHADGLPRRWPPRRRCTPPRCVSSPWSDWGPSSPGLLHTARSSGSRRSRQWISKHDICVQGRRGSPVPRFLAQKAPGQIIRPQAFILRPTAAAAALNSEVCHLRNTPCAGLPCPDVDGRAHGRGHAPMAARPETFAFGPNGVVR